MMPVTEKKYRSWYLALAGVGVVSMILADCRSATFGFLVGILILLFFTRHLVAGTLVLASGAVLAVFSGAGKSIMLYLARGQQTKELEGLSGRVEFWQFGWQKFLERPFTGWGGFAGGRFLILPQISDPSQPMPSDLHSNIMEPIVDTGIFGLLFILLALFGVWWYLYKGFRSPRLNGREARLAAECMVVLALLTVRFTVSDREVDADGATPILVAGEEAGALLPSGCRMGICNSCVGRLTAGAVRDLRTGDIQRADGQLVRTCCSAAAGAVEIEL